MRKPGRKTLIRAGLVVSLALAAQVVVGSTPATAVGIGFDVTMTSDVLTNTGACGNSGILSPPNPAALSLREAVCLANNVGNQAIIVIPSGVYTLSFGQLKVGLHSGQNVTLQGAGAASTIIDAAGSSRVLDFDDNLLGGIAGTVSNLTIKGGADSVFGGAGIIAGSGSSPTADTLSIDHSIITGNAADASTPTVTNKPGGGVQFVGGTLSITDSVISNNSSASSPGSGVAYEATGTTAGEHLTVTNTTFSGNSALNSNGTSVTNGGALDLRGLPTTTFTVSDSKFTGNSVVATTAGALGAAIRQESGHLVLSRSNFSGNSVVGGSPAPAGGAVEITTGTATMNYNRFAGNTAASGSAIHVGAGADAGAVDATENWFGCNGGPGAGGCDTVVAAAPATAAVTPRLFLTVTAGSSTVTGPNATTAITGSFGTDSASAPVSSADLTVFDALPMQFTDPKPIPATVAGNGTSATAAFSSGLASVTYNSQSASGSGHVVTGFDSTSITVPITVNRPPAVTTDPSTQSVNVGNAATFTAAATGFPTPTVQWQRSTDGGGSFTNIAGATSTTYSFTAVLADNGNQYRAVFTNFTSATSAGATLNVGQPPTFTSPGTALFVTGTAGSFTVTTSGTPPVTAINRTGTLPAGLTYTDNGDGTATIAGTPITGAGGTYPVTLTATNGLPPNGTQNLTVQVNQAPAITASPSDQTVNPGTSVSFTAAGTGVPTPTVQWQRSTDGGGAYNNIAGATSTTYTFTAVAGDNSNRYRAVFTNSINSATTSAATLRVGTAPAFTSIASTVFAVGSAGSYSVAVSGIPDSTLTTSGSLPSWLAFTDNGNGTGVLAGTPPTGAGGQYTFTLTAANGFSPDASQAFTLSVDESPTITSADHATFTVGTAGSFAVTTKAGFPLATFITRTGVLPSGVSFVDNGGGTATLAGTPGSGTAGVYTLTVTAGATGSVTTAQAQTFTLTVNGPPVITSTDHSTFSVAASGAFTVQSVAGYPTVTTLTRTGTLPTGVTFVDNSDGTATLSGTPAVGQGGVYPITITAANGVAPNATQSFVLTVNEPSKITSVDHVTFAKGTLGAFTVTTSAGQPAATALLASPTLPPGVTFADNGNGTATLSGVPIADGMYSLTITAANGVAPSATQTFTVTVTGAPTITSAPNATFVVNAPGTFTVTTIAGTPTATSLSEIGSLPDGVTFVDNGDGSATLAGTPALGTGGQYPITIKAANAVANSPTAFTLTVTELPEITSVDHATFTVGTSGTFAVSTVAGFPSATALTETGVLPGGVTFVDNGNGTATLGGTPDAGSGGSYPVTFTATNSAGHTDLPFILTVQEAPVITSADHTTFKVGAAGTFDVTTGAGFPTGPSLVKAGALPGGVTFVDNGDGTATIAGTPSAGTGGAYPITITAGNGVTTDDSQSFTLTVDQVPVITSADHVAMTANSPGTFTVTTTGFPGIGITESGSLPSGVTFTDNGDGTATLTGTPAAGTGGSYPLTLTAGNGVAPDDTQSFTLTIHQGPAITSTDHVQFTVGSAGTFALTTTGVPNAMITETGALPGGVTLVDHADGTATLAGTPASATGGTYPITLTASNGINPDAAQSFTLTVNEAPAISSADHATFTVGTAGTLTVTTAGYPNASFTHSGVLPAGVALTDNNDGTATLAGTPAASTDGSYPITIFASNGVGLVATQTFTLAVIKAAQAITVTSIAPPSVAVGATYALSALSDSGLGVTYLVDAATTNSACSLATSTVSFDHTGSCVIDFNQAGDGTYAAAPQVQQVIAVSTVATNVAVVTSTPSTVFGQATHATATISADSGTPAGTVQFAIDGNSLGAPVTVSGGGAVSPDLTGAGGSALAPGSYSVTAAFTPDDATTYASSQGVATQIVNQAGTTLALSVDSTTVTATVTAVAPGAGAPTGSVAFAVGGLSVGTATVSGGVATLSYPVPAGKTQQVAATYAGDVDFTGSSTSTARNDPTLTATISSAHGKTRYGWYRSAVTVTFRCTTQGAPLTAACPAAVHLTRSGAGQSVTRTIKATDGGVNTVVVKGINIDLVRPTVKVTGIKNNAAYNGRAPAAHCVAKDSLSGVASCTITRHVSGAKTSYKATATDRAGNAASVSGSYSVFTNSLAGAKFENGAFDVKLGHTYTLVVYASSRPTYYDAAPYPQRPTKRDTAMRSAGHGRWTLGVTMTRSLSHYKYWNLGVKIGPTIHVIKIRVS